MPTRSYEHLVGAYGAVGFSGVKDARRESFLADASASAAFSTALEGKGCKKIAEGKQLESSSIANQERLDSKGIAP
jgi:hypothetical protein